MEIIFWISIYLIFWAMIGYNISILLLGKIKSNQNEVDFSHQPTVTILVVAHNEEKVIKDKLENLLMVNYPSDKLQILVSSDNSCDATNEIVTQYTKKYPHIKLYEVKQRKGKTNAQNEAVKMIDSEYIVFTDANAMLHQDAIKHLMSSFTHENIVYVCGNLIYKNELQSNASDSEATYWNTELKIRDIESHIQTITAGNGALYALRKKDYVEVELIKSHDSAFPLLFGLQNKRCINNSNAKCFEKAGESYQDEYKRKVRMNRSILFDIIPTIKIFNIFKYRWFTYFYFGHRSLRYSLWFLHIVALISNALLFSKTFYLWLLILHCLFYTFALIQHILKTNNKILTLIYYYTITIIAQLHGVYNIITKKTKPFWEKAETTR